LTPARALVAEQYGVAADRDSIKGTLKTWTGGEKSAARKQKLFDDRLLDLALNRLATFN
jgi:hypothetical protein